MKYTIICLLLPLLLFAQSSSENFILTKSVIDASGGSAVSESFEQVNSVGQSTPIGVQESENFTLSAGFLHPQFSVSPLSPIQELVIKANQPHVNLWWETISGAGSYTVYRDTLSTFTPSATNLLGTTPDTTYIDPNVASSASDQYYYIVTSSP